MRKHLFSRALIKAMICFMLLLGMQSVVVNASMVTTSAAIEFNNQYYTPDDLQTALQSEALINQLVDAGVDTNPLQDRIASLTPAEIAYLNAELENQPAGAGVVGVLLTIFIVFIITDALCATDIFSFVNCINK